MSQALYRKWRPRKWDQVVAQDHIVQTLRNAIKAEKVGHAYLFSGPRGTGKTTTARLLAKAVNCLNSDLAERPCDDCVNCLAVNEGRFLDLIEIDAASNTSVEDIRTLRERINYSPSDGKYKVYIIDEVHMLSTAAFNALLKTLEEPPAHAIFILATTEIHKIPPTVLSRCQRHEFRRIPVEKIVDALQGICAEEKFVADEEALLLIARQSTGAMRDAISLLDQLASSGKQIDLELAQTVLGTATSQLVFDLIDALIKNDPGMGMRTIHKALDGGSDPRQYARQVVEYLRSLLLVKMGNEKQVEATKEVKSRMREHSALLEIGLLMNWIDLFNVAINDLRTSWQPSLALEVAFARSLSLRTVENHPPLAADSSTPAHVRPAVTENAASTSTAPVMKIPEIVVEGSINAAPTAEPEKPAAVKIQPPAEEALTAAEKSPGSVNKTITTEDILSIWNEIKIEVKQRRKQAEALLNSQRYLQVRNGTLILGFPSEVLRSKMANQENIEVLRRVLTSKLNVDLPIDCILVNDKTGTAIADSLVESNGLVETALNLGGKLKQKTELK